MNKFCTTFDCVKKFKNCSDIWCIKKLGLHKRFAKLSIIPIEISVFLNPVKNVKTSLIDIILRRLMMMKSFSRNVSSITTALPHDQPRCRDWLHCLCWSLESRWQTCPSGLHLVSSGLWWFWNITDISKPVFQFYFLACYDMNELGVETPLQYARVPYLQQ